MNKINITSIIIEKSHDGSYNCFRGYCDGKFFTGNNISGENTIVNYKNFNNNQIEYILKSIV